MAQKGTITGKTPLLRCEGLDLFLMPNFCDLQDLQELQCFLMVHIGRNACKSRFLMCILQNELRWVIIAHMFYLFKRRWVIGGRLLIIARRGNPLWLPASVEAL